MYMPSAMREGNGIDLRHPNLKSKHHDKILIMYSLAIEPANYYTDGGYPSDLNRKYELY